jgi:hypothetical protein
MKIKRTLYRVFILLLGLLASAPLAADDNTYDIEIVVFERPGGGGGESWPADPGTPDRSSPGGWSSPGGRSGRGRTWASTASR